MKRSLLIISLVLSGCTCNENRPAAPSSRGGELHRTPAAGRPQPATPEPGLPLDDPRVERAQATVKRLKTTLKEALAKALEQGPGQAIQVCSVKAQELAHKFSVDGVEVGRTSHRLRNPKNVTRPWVQPLLQDYLRQPQKPRYRAVELEHGVGYVEPIYTSRICLMCHGSDLAPPVASKIQELYPKDQATGFAPGEIRGVFWAEVKRDKKR